MWSPPLNGISKIPAVRTRPDTSTSERQLILALAAGGRDVSLEQLALWRKNGLLPPLASYGIRTQGRCYYWHEPDILARAELVHDALRKNGRNESATVSLWLHGFDVPPSRVRRAWLHRARQAAPARIRPVTGISHGTGSLAETLSGILLSATLHAAASMEWTLDPAFPILRRAGAALGFAPGRRDFETQLYWQAATAMLLALSSSDVVHGASDDEMREAQGHLQVGLRFLAVFCRDESPAGMIESLGPPLFLFVLALLRSGQHAVIQNMMDRIGRKPVLSRQIIQDDAREPAPAYS